jgi:TRAP-type C4-dicarboxylate transport system substrate-binding protein
MKVKLIFGLFVSLLIVALLLGGCSQTASTTSSAPASSTAAPKPSTTLPPTSSAPPVTVAPSSSAPASTQVIELKFSFTVPAASGKGKFQQQWIDKIQQAANGRVKITPYWASSLLSMSELYRGTQAGLTDFACLNPSVEAGTLSLSQFTMLPLLAFPDNLKSDQIWSDIYNKYPELQQEYKGVNLVYAYFYGGNTHLCTTKKQVTTQADVQGMKILHTGGNTAKMISALGGAGVLVQYGDWFMALDKGLVEGTFANGYGSSESQGLLDLYKFNLKLGAPIQQGFETIIANPDSWKKLPPDIQKIITDLSPWYYAGVDQLEKDTDTRVIAAQKAKGYSYTQLTPDELAKWIKLAQPIHEEWIKANESKNARAIYQDIQNLILKYK